MLEKSLDLTRIRGICFDVDGTLSDTDDVWTQDLAGLLRPVNFMFKGRNPNPMARRVVMAIESPGNAVFTALDVLHLDRFVNRLMLRLKNRLGGGKPPHFQVIPGVPAMLSTLAARYPLAVVSMRDEDNTLRFLNTFSLRSHFGWIASSQTTVYTKPFPDPILWVAQQMGCSPSELLMVGDTTVDIRAGKAAGAQTVGVLCGFGQRDELQRAGADLILPSTADLSGLFVA